MKILIAPNAFKGSLSAADAVKSIEAGVKSVLPDSEIISMPVSDGGDGFVQALEYGLDLESYFAEVSGSLGRRLQASFLYSSQKQIAIIEMAAASGLALLADDELDPMLASTFGVGELILAALNLGAQHFIIGIGGSATSDGGTGMAAALGVHFFDASGVSLVGNAKNLCDITRIDVSQLDSRLSQCTFDVACDVSNLLLGDEGAARVYAPQKGASPAQVLLIEKGLSNLAGIIERDVGINVRETVSGGAAGGLGAGLVAFLGAKLKPGADLLLDMQQFDSGVKNADLVITTEGKLDNQTCFGKAPFVVAKRAGQQNVPTIMIAGQLELTAQQIKNAGFSAVYCLSEGDVTIDYAIAHASELLLKKTKNAVSDFF